MARKRRVEELIKRTIRRILRRVRIEKIHQPKLRRTITVFRDPETGRFVPQVIMRYSAGLKLVSLGEEYDGSDDDLAHVIPVHTQKKSPPKRGELQGYYGAIAMAWIPYRDYEDPDIRRQVEDQVVTMLYDRTEEIIGYPAGMWWFESDYGDGWQEIHLADYDKREREKIINLLYRVYYRFEEEDGSAIETEWSRLVIERGEEEEEREGEEE